MPAFNRHDPVFGKNARNLMKTDVRETENAYELDIDLPGFKKDEVKIELDGGYLTISAAKGLDKDEETRRDSICAANATPANAAAASTSAKPLSPRTFPLPLKTAF